LSNGAWLGFGSEEKKKKNVGTVCRVDEEAFSGGRLKLANE